MNIVGGKWDSDLNITAPDNIEGASPQTPIPEAEPAADIAPTEPQTANSVAPEFEQAQTTVVAQPESQDESAATIKTEIYGCFSDSGLELLESERQAFIKKYSPKELIELIERDDLKNNHHLEYLLAASNDAYIQSHLIDIRGVHLSVQSQNHLAQSPHLEIIKLFVGALGNQIVASAINHLAQNPDPEIQKVLLDTYRESLKQYILPITANALRSQNQEILLNILQICSPEYINQIKKQIIHLSNDPFIMKNIFEAEGGDRPSLRTQKEAVYSQNQTAQEFYIRYMGSDMGMWAQNILAASDTQRTLVEIVGDRLIPAAETTLIDANDATIDKLLLKHIGRRLAPENQQKLRDRDDPEIANLAGLTFASENAIPASVED